MATVSSRLRQGVCISCMYGLRQTGDCRHEPECGTRLQLLDWGRLREASVLRPGVHRGHPEGVPRMTGTPAPCASARWRSRCTLD